MADLDPFSSSQWPGWIEPEGIKTTRISVQINPNITIDRERLRSRTKETIDEMSSKMAEVKDVLMSFEGIDSIIKYVGADNNDDIRAIENIEVTGQAEVAPLKEKSLFETSLKPHLHLVYEIHHRTKLQLDKDQIQYLTYSILKDDYNIARPSSVYVHFDVLNSDYENARKYVRKRR